MKIYIDSDFKCHTSAAEGLTEVETDAFRGKCGAYIESFRFVPSGKSWVRSDGEVFDGEMISVWKDISEIEDEQRAYEREKLADAENALAILLGGEIT